MSTYWDVYCRTCKSEMGIQDANHRLDEMRVIASNARAIASIREILRDADLRISRTDGSSLNVGWLDSHKDHDLVARDEYGNIDGECGRNIVCLCCASHVKCNLEVGHPGHCEKKARSTAPV